MDIEKQNKLNDIRNVSFGSDIQEIVSSLEILLALLEIDDDKEIIAACKNRLQEGISILKNKNYNKLDEFNTTLC